MINSYKMRPSLKRFIYFLYKSNKHFVIIKEGNKKKFTLKGCRYSKYCNYIGGKTKWKMNNY